MERVRVLIGVTTNDSTERRYALIFIVAAPAFALTSRRC